MEPHIKDTLNSEDTAVNNKEKMYSSFHTNFTVRCKMIQCIVLSNHDV